jgi:hypothetical protein
MPMSVTADHRGMTRSIPLDAIDGPALPQISPFNLHRSLHAVEAVVVQAGRTRDAVIKRSLLRAGCELLDHALRCTQERPSRRHAG